MLRVVQDGTYKEILSLVKSLPDKEYHFIAPNGRFIDSPHCKVRIIIKDGHKVAAFIEGYVFDDAPDTMVIVYAVAPAYRSQGCAHHLIYQAMDRAKEMGLKIIFARVDKENYPSQKLLRRIGFHELKRNPDQISYIYELDHYTPLTA